MVNNKTKKLDPVEETSKNEKPPKESDPKEIGASEIGGRDGLEPTRYGDWEGTKGGLISDF